MKVMKRFLAMLLCVAMVATLFAGLTLTASAATVTGSFVKCTSLSDVTTGDYIIVGAKTTSSFGRLTYGTLNSSRLAYTQEWTSAPAGPLSNPDGASVWHLEVSGTNVTIYNAENSKYLNSGFSLATSNPTTYTIAYTSNYFTLKNGSNYIGVNKSANYWRTYGSSTLTNNGNLLLFKKSTSKVLSSIAVSSNHGTFTVGDTFVKETVTATYSDSSTADVTNSATFSGYNMSSAGMQTVNVSYTEGSTTKNTSYTINVVAPTPHTLTYSVNGDTSVFSGGSYNSGTSVTLPANVTAPAGYTFVGWLPTTYATNDTAPSGLITGTSYTMPSADTTLYAVYAELGEGGTSETFKLYITKSGSDYYIGTHGSNIYFATASTESDAIEFGVEDGEYLYCIDGGTKYYVYNTADNTTTSFTTEKANATKWTITDNDDTIQFQSKASGGRYLALNTNPYRFSTYGSSYSHVFTKIGCASVEGYTTNPVLENSHTVTWLNYDNTEFKQTSVKESSTVTAPAETPECPDSDNHYYEFAGWSETAGGTVVTAFPTMGANDRTYYAVFTENTYNYSASISGSSTMIVGQPMQLNVDLTSTPAGSNPDYTVTWSSSDSDFTVDENGKVTALAEGNATITATISAYGHTYTATKNVSAEVKAVFTLMTPDNQPIGNDWSGEYVIAGRVHNVDTYANNYVIFDASNSNGILNNTDNVKQISSTGINLFADGSLYAMEGNSGSHRHQVDGEDLVLDNKMVDVSDDYIWVIERIDDVNNIYTIKEKKYDIYLAADSETGSNTIAFSPNATDEAQWKFETWILNDDNANVPTTGDSYRNEIVVIRNVKYDNKLFLYNTWASQNGQNISNIGSGGVFRTYSYEYYGPSGIRRHPGDVLGYYNNADDQVYNIYLFGNPNPFTAQIFYQGDQKTIVNAAEVQEGKTAELTGLLTPDIEMTLGWSFVSGPTWEITSSNDNSMSINSTTGVFDSGSANAGDYAFVTLSYVVHDDVNGVDHTVSTQAKVVITPTSESYVGVIFEDYSTEETENTYTVVASVNSLPLDFYIHEVSQGNTVYHDGRTTDPAFTIVPGTWSATSTNDYTVSVDANGVLDLSHVTGEAIITVTHSGATANSRTVPDFTYKVYVKDVGYTLTVVPTTDSLGTYDVDSDTITVAGNENSAHLTFNVVDDLGNGPSASTFTVAGYAWTISGESYGATINSNGVLNFSEMDRSEDHTITAVVYRATATDVNTGVMKTGLTDTITIEVKARTVVEVMEAVNDLVIVDYALPVTFNVLTNDNINVTVDVTAGTLPTGVTDNGSGFFTFRPSGWQTTDQTFTYTVAGIVNGASATATATVTLKTADSVYYEDTYSGIFTFEGNWTNLADGDPIAEQTSSLDTADIFEHDANYESYAQYSGGTAKKTTVVSGMAAANRPSVSFTFAGTGFDVISATTNNGGAVLMTIKDADNHNVTDPVTHRNLNAIYDNFRGYVYCEDEYTRYTLDQVKRGDWDGSEFKANPGGAYYYDRDNNEYKTPANGKWYALSGDDTAGSGINLYDCYSLEEATAYFTDYEDAAGTFIIKEYQSHWKPYEKDTAEADTYNTNFYQIPIMKITGLPYGTYTVTLTPTYSSAYDRAGDGSYDFIFDGVRIHNPVANRDAEYKYINFSDIVDADGFGSGEIIPCDHVGTGRTDWMFFSKATNTTDPVTRNRGSFVRYCTYCGAVTDTAYFHVSISASNDVYNIGVDGYNDLPDTTVLRYTLTADAGDNQTAVQAKLDAMQGTLTEYWSSHSRAIMTCMSNSNVVIARGEGTTYATLQLKDPATQVIYASAIHSPNITVEEDTSHKHVWSDWAHDADSDPSTHSRTCSADGCEVGSQTENCSFTDEVTTAPTYTTTGVRTYTCSGCGYTYTEEIPVLTGYTATFHVPEGATAPAQQTGNSVTMPAAVAAPAAFDAHNYTFVGWVESTVSDTTTEQTVYEAGASIDLSADTDFYALYTYGGNAGGYTLSSTAPQAGDSVIIAAEKDGTYYAMPQDSFTGEALTVSGNTATNVDGLTWTAYDASYSGSTGIGFNNGTNPLHMNSSALKVASGDQNGTFEFTASGDGFIVYSNQNTRWMKYNGSSFGVANAASGATPIVFFISSGATYYTTELLKACTHTNTTTTTTAATCTTAGSTVVTCDDCGKVISNTTIPVTEHTYTYSDNHDDKTHSISCAVCHFNGGNESHTWSGDSCSKCGAEKSTSSDPVWRLLENASDLKSGMNVVFASKEKGKTAGDISNAIMASVDSTFSSDGKTITSLGSDTVQMTVGGSSGAWTFSNGSALLGATAVKKLAWGSGTTTWSVSVSNGDATIQNGTSTYGRFLYNVGSPRFTTYTSATSATMLLPQIYYLDNGTKSATRSATRSIVASGDYNGIAIIDGKGNTTSSADHAAYGPEHGVYLAPGQGIVFYLTSDVTTITSQDLQIGAKAVNGTAAAIDVASISNGTEYSGVKYLLESKEIASATEMYYELDGSQVSWKDGTSSIIVVYNSGSGVLDVTNLRYSTANGNTLTMHINEAATKKASKMIQIVYGEPVTDPDPIEPSDLALNFASAELVLNSDIAINFNVDEKVYDSADGVYAVFTKALYNEAGEITGYAEETVNEAAYNEETGLYSFRFTGINPAEMGSAVTATLYGYRDGELVEGKTVNYSVLTYINNMYGKVDNAKFRTLLADLAAYGEAAQNYINYNTANLVTANVADGLMDYATTDAPELNNCTAISGDGAVKFTGAYLSLREKVTVCYMIDAQEYAGNVADLELRIFDGARQIGTATFAEVGGKYIASFSGLNALQMRTVLTAEVYNGDTCVSNTLDYSIESYAAGKAAGNDALAALVNAMMNFGISAETYFAK